MKKLPKERIILLENWAENKKKSLHRLTAEEKKAFDKIEYFKSINWKGILATDKEAETLYKLAKLKAKKA